METTEFVKEPEVKAIFKKEPEVKAIHKIERVNLYDFAYEKSGSVKGDPDLYELYLKRILNGDLVENNTEVLNDSEKREKFKEIKSLEKQLNELEEGNSKFEEQIKFKEKDIDKYRKELLQIREKRSKSKGLLKSESFSTLKFSLNLFVLVMLSVYLFFFYVSAAFKALYVDFEGIAERIAQGEGTGSIMPGASELAEALQYNYLLFVVPFVFYAFGWAFHIILEIKSKAKFVFLSLLIAVTFAVDFLLAMIISNNTESAKTLMGLTATPWSQSPTFYIILFLGFLVYIIWSILLDSLLKEWDKKEMTNNLNKIIKHLNDDVKILRQKLVDLKPIKNKIADFREDVSTIMSGNLKRYVDQFSSGWLSYLSPVNMKDAKETCLAIKKDFEEKNNIKSGTVKVTSRRFLGVI